MASFGSGRGFSRLALMLLLLLGAATRLTHAIEVPAKPANGVADPDGLLEPAARRALEAQLVAYAQGTTTRYGVALFRSLDDEAIEPFAIRIAEAWKIGSRTESDGVLILVFAAERKVRIEVGYGLEGKLPDVVCARVIREQIAPRFREGDLLGGITRALATIDQLATGRAPEATRPRPAPTPSAPVSRAPTFSSQAEEPGSSGLDWLWPLLVLIAVAGGVYALIERLSRRPGDIGPARDEDHGPGGSVASGSSRSSGTTFSSKGAQATSGRVDEDWGASSASGGRFGGGGATGGW